MSRSFSATVCDRTLGGRDAGVVSVGGEFGGDLELEPASAEDLRNHGRVGDDEDTAHVEHDGIDVLGQDLGPE